MRVLLASAPHADTFGYSMPPPGLLRLGGALERAGHEAVLEDLAFRQASGALREDDALCSDAAELLLSHGPVDLLGLSVMGATLPAALRIAEHYAAARPQTPILIGGPGTTGTDRLLLERFPQVTAVVRGEGEVTLLRVLDRLAAGRTLAGVAGVTHRAGTEVQREEDREALRDLNDLPAPAWHLVPPLSAYKAVTGEAEGLVPVDSGRGCSYDCSFCTIGRYWGRRSRPLPAERL
ncbi:MAG: cobalamin-dependent protein, partial [Planctomycetota bacterium]|nr:cobalamin-dependent protein [Planctomycetota bacterium]